MTAAPFALKDYFPAVPTEDWLAAIARAMDEPSHLEWTCDGLRLAPFYRAGDIRGAPDPGISSGWHICEWFDIADLPKAATGAAASLSSGATAIGFTSRTRAPVAAEMAKLVSNLSLDATSIHWDGPHVGVRPLLLARTRDLSTLRGSMVADPITGSLRYGQQPRYDTLPGLLEEPHTPHFRVYGIDAAVFHEQGATAIEELACTIGAASELLAQLTHRGLPAARVAAAISFRVAVGTRFFPEIAKLRALRHLARQLFEAYGTPDVQPDVFAVASPYRHTCLDPESNLLRATSQAMAGVIGGCNTLSVPPLVRLAPRLSRNLQLVLKHEAHLDWTADPARGSYFVERLTDELALAAWGRFREYERAGGLLQALQSGELQHMLRCASMRHAQEVAAGECTMVGVNDFPRNDAIQGMTPGTGPAAPYEALRLRVNAQPVQCLLLEGGSTRLRQLARRQLRCAGIEFEEGSLKGTRTPYDFVVTVLPPVASLAQSLPFPVVGVLAEKPVSPIPGVETCLYPGQNMPRAIGSLLDKLNSET